MNAEIHNSVKTNRSMDSFMADFRRRFDMESFSSKTGIFELSLERDRIGNYVGIGYFNKITLQISKLAARQIVRRIAFRGDGKCSGVIVFYEKDNFGIVMADTDTEWCKMINKKGITLSRCEIKRVSSDKNTRFVVSTKK